MTLLLSILGVVVLCVGLAASLVCFAGMNDDKQQWWEDDGERVPKRHPWM